MSFPIASMPLPAPPGALVALYKLMAATEVRGTNCSMKSCNAGDSGRPLLTIIEHNATTAFTSGCVWWPHVMPKHIASPARVAQITWFVPDAHLLALGCLEALVSHMFAQTRDLGFVVCAIGGETMRHHFESNNHVWRPCEHSTIMSHFVCFRPETLSDPRLDLIMQPVTLERVGSDFYTVECEHFSDGALPRATAVRATPPETYLPYYGSAAPAAAATAADLLFASLL